MIRMNENDLDHAVIKVKNLSGEKKRMVIKAVVNYINAMVGNE